MRTTFATLPGSAKPNEDFIAVADDLVVVLDGATTPGAVITGCSHTTRWFARSLGTEIFRHVEADPLRALADSLALAIQTLSTRHQATCDVTHPGHPSATVAMLRETADAFDYLVLADSTVVIDTYAAGIQVIMDNRLDKVAEADHARLLATVHGSPEHEVAFAEFTTKLQKFRNRTGGLWVASTDPDAAYQAILGKVGAELVHAALLTDGASRLVDRFQQADWGGVLDTLSLDGPGQLVDLVRKAEATDPDGTRWQRGKVHDDATAVYCVP